VRSQVITTAQRLRELDGESHAKRKRVDSEVPARRDEKQVESRGTETRVESRGERTVGKGACFTYGKTGHIARDCPDRRRT
jgi:hypothetical protein